MNFRFLVNSNQGFFITTQARPPSASSGTSMPSKEIKLRFIDKCIKAKNHDKGIRIYLMT